MTKRCPIACGESRKQEGCPPRVVLKATNRIKDRQEIKISYNGIKFQRYDQVNGTGFAVPSNHFNEVISAS